MSIIEAIRKYFHGENKEEKVHRFDSLNTTINECRSALDEKARELNSMVKGVDVVREAANTLINSGDITPDNLAIALDNMRFKDASLSNYMGQFTSDVKKLEKELMKAESEMVSLISENSNMASIIIDVKHDERLEKSLESVLKAYKDKEVDKTVVIKAFNNAKSIQRTDRDLSLILNSYLKDN